MGCKELRSAVNEGLIKVYQVNDQQFVNKAYGILHKGELEVVVAALENNIKMVIIDEKTARDFAKTLNLNPLGVIGVLRLAKQTGKIEFLRPYLDKLISHKYRISEKIYLQVLQESGELK